ncbi:hypothetical protein TRFO_38572 [Tritrichomonas foetus]|uniref:Uncharacterized protein n=1 Tax=Tritrichomonas foetus TaxID=1144522 RepID=A0A1J4J9I2_9EUKA|nr:hypothetical protein TRFO_38572 [Tritrichomonas foetus]|eukprot:OHS95321.1 hypothetical protein TRFO_38572 [Tritrichomonas foetus]
MKSIQVKFRDFYRWTIIINNKKFRTTKPKAFYLSPVLKNFSDKYPDFNSCKLEIEDAEQYEELISSIFAMKDISINIENIDFLKRFSRKLQISLFDSAFQEFENYFDLVEETTNEDQNLKTLKIMERTFLKLSNERIDRSFQLLQKCKIDDLTFSTSLYGICISQPQKIDIYIELLTKYKAVTINKFKDIVFDNLKSQKKQEIYYIIYQMIHYQILDNKELIKRTNGCLPLFYAHLLNPKKITDILHEDQTIDFDLTESSNNNWELHHKNCINGKNEHPIAVIIRRDDIDTLQQFLSQNNFPKNATIPISIYERFSFINERNVKLIDFAAFFGSIKCFKFLMLNDFDFSIHQTFVYAVCGGMSEIVHLCEEKKCEIKGSLLASVQFHRHDFFDWLIDIKNMNYSDDLIPAQLLQYFNITSLINCINRGIDPTKFIFPSVLNGNLIFLKYLVTINEINLNVCDSNGMTPLHYACEKGFEEIVSFLIEKCDDTIINSKGHDDMTPLHIACQNVNESIIKLLLNHPKIDVCVKTVYLVLFTKKFFKKSQNGLTPLHLACKSGNQIIISLLLKMKNIDINSGGIVLLAFYNVHFIYLERSCFLLISNVFIFKLWSCSTSLCMPNWQIGNCKIAPRKLKDK